MPGALMQLVAYGAQDVYLTGNPQTTYFKTTYRRHTNFSMECIRQTLDGTVGAGNRVVATISRNGDLIHDCFIKLQTNLGNTTGSNPGHNMIDYIEVEIGGQLIDRHYGHWMEAHAELTELSGRTTSEFLNYSNISQFTDEDDGDNCNNPSMFQLTAGAGGVEPGRLLGDLQL